MRDFTDGVGSNGLRGQGNPGNDGCRDSFVSALALLPTIGMLRLTGLLLGLPLEDNR